jgi:hypothetical protein
MKSILVPRWPVAWLLLLLAAVLVGCDGSTVPPPPPITVVITAVDDTAALEQGVAEALAATAQVNIGLTETVLAQGGVTLTPTVTPTASITPTATTTRDVTATITPTPTETQTPTYSPLSTNTPSTPIDLTTSWVRVVNFWKLVGENLPPTQVDVFINDTRVARSVPFGQPTNFFQLRPGSVRIAIRAVDAPTTTGLAEAPLGSALVEVPPSGVISVMALDDGQRGVELLPVVEDASPLPAGRSRLTIVQANPILLPIDLSVSVQRLQLARALTVGEVAGPLEVSTGEFTIDFLDSQNPTQTVFSMPPILLNSQVSYTLVLLPPDSARQGLTTWQLITSTTRRVVDDVGVRFINAMPNIGGTDIVLDGNSVLENLLAGAISDVLPLSALGARLDLAAASGNLDRPVFQGEIGPWIETSERSTDKLIIFSESAAGAVYPGTVTVLSQNPPVTAINANIRLVHALPGGAPLSIQVRTVPPPIPVLPGTPQPPNDQPWISLGDTPFTTASDYINRIPAVYDVRVLQAGSQVVIDELDGIQMLAGGVYDFLVTSGSEPGSARLVLLQPSTQITNVSNGQDNATAVFEAVGATLTALAPVSNVTPTRAFTPTPTRTPIPTNTPRPTNTPDFAPPQVQVFPAPPDTALATINLSGQNFAPGGYYEVRVNDNATLLAAGTVANDGSIFTEVRLLDGLPSGAHTLQVCVNCQTRLPQAAYAVFLVANPNITPTATAQP